MKSDVIANLFNWRFDDIRLSLPTLASRGYGGVQVSPPQKSIATDEWWGRYQPIDHTKIEGPLGSENDLRNLIQTAHALNPPLQVIVDVVLNHMAERSPTGVNLEYARFCAEHFHPRAAIDWNSLQSIRTGWIGYGPDLPDLRTELPYVRAEARNYLQMLVDLGVDGFRLDAVKHIEPEFFDEVLRPFTGALAYGEYIPQPGHMPVMAGYLGSMRLLDFPFLEALGSILDTPGGLDQLCDLGKHFELVPDSRSVGFVTNHDIELNQYGGFRLASDAVDMANAVVLVLHSGPPLVWHEHVDHPVVLAAMRLRKIRQRLGTSCVLRGPDCAAWRTGTTGLLVLNTGQTERTLNLTELGMRHVSLKDCTRQCVYDSELIVPPRAVVLAIAI